MSRKVKKKRKKGVKRFNPLEQALMKVCTFGKYKDRTYGWIVKNDVFWLHWYNQSNQYSNFPAALCIRFLCQKYPIEKKVKKGIKRTRIEKTVEEE
jgi:hypothetical protein